MFINNILILYLMQEKHQIHHKRQPRVRIDSLGIWLRKHDIDRHRLTRRTNKPRLNALHE